MVEGKEKYLMKYCEYLGSTSMSYDSKGKYVVAVTYYLCNASSVNKRGYNDFKKKHAYFVSFNKFAAEAICHFLSFNGVGYGKKINKPNNSAPLEKREIRQEQTINDFILWLQNEKDYSPNTIQAYINPLKKYYSYFDEFSQDNCLRFIESCEQKGFRPKTINIFINSLNKHGQYLKKPVNIKRRKIVRTLFTDNIPTPSEYEKLCEYLKTHSYNYYIMIRVLGTTGCRISELKQITFEHLELGGCSLKCKGTKYRQFFFTKDLQRLAKGRKGPVMIGVNGMPLSSRGFSEGLKKYCEKCNIDRSKGHAHAFRHFFAKMYLKKTKDVIQLSELLGHESVDTTRIYLQKSHDEQQKEINRVVNW